MTIQTVLSQYPKVEKAVAEFLANNGQVLLLGTYPKYEDEPLIDMDAHFNTLEGHIRSFMRENGIYMDIKPMVADNFFWSIVKTSTLEVIDNSAAHQNERGTMFYQHYELAFLSALNEACKYLEGKL